MAHTLVWMPTNEILKKVPCTCIDGRTQGIRYSVAGGSFGLFLHTLATIQTAEDRCLSQDDVDRYMRLFASEVGPVYLHSDQHTIDRIFARMGLETETRLRDLNASQQRSFCELATTSELQGCGHIKLIMQNPIDYQIPPALVSRAIKAFFRLYFGQVPNVMFDVLAGRHREESVLLLEEQFSKNLDQESALLLAEPMEQDRFFCHRPLKQALAERFLKAIDAAGLPGLDRSSWPTLIQAHNRAAETTLNALAPELNVDHIRL
ncbi:hypothetical protein [Saccharospirillum impatiens]|uniref:hypothetical protein n=1 Tax=Saccharospirillum impatiens TaxID=169438 RepID=UPI00041C2474|nr:hypothetical protein [Saccharospirillum impatiens]